MPLVRKRRAPAGDGADRSSSEDGARRRRQRSSSSDAGGPADNTPTNGLDASGADGDGGSSEQMVKKLVRLALASEYARQPIRRADIGTKVLGHQGRQFKQVFNGAQNELRRVFGMEMTELPMREKITISQRRAAQRTEKTATSSKAYILTSTLGDIYHADDAILPPPKVPTAQAEATYVGLYTFIISVISLSGGSIGEAKLERYLKRTNADQYTPLDKTEKVLQRLCKEGYLVKVKDSSGGEEVVEYMVGPRGKVEIGEAGVAGLVKKVYGDGGADDEDDLEARIQRSLGVEEGGLTRKDKQKSDGEGGTTRPRGRPRRAAGGAAEEEDDEEEEEESEDG
ncbi:MAG: Altered inheritance of mitochondria protein 18 mitochondrial [Caeruleum heppii]|nr:MAG: Altered inheritance of mitochondria protein 18 mitochondrial [Caeruleum heppii]